MRIAAAGGESIGAVYDGEPGIDRAALVRGPGGHVYKLFCGMETGRRAARRRPADPLRARLGQGPQPRPDRALPRRGLGFAFSDRMGRTASWWHCDADHHGMALIFGPAPRALPLRLVGARPQRDGPDRRPPRRPRPEADLGAEPPRPRHNLFIYFKDADGAMVECCADLAAMPPHGDYEAKRWPGGFGAINQWGGPPPPRFLLAGYPIANASPAEWLR